MALSIGIYFFGRASTVYYLIAWQWEKMDLQKMDLAGNKPAGGSLFLAEGGSD